MDNNVTITANVIEGSSSNPDVTAGATVQTNVAYGTPVSANVVTGGKGDQGDQGIQGIQGVQGIQGETGAGVPDGGTTAQVLRKASNTDQDTEWHTSVKADVGLSNVDDTSDASKPVSTATQIALDAKVTGPASVTDDLPAIFDGTTGKLIKSKTYAAFKTLLSLVKGDVGLGNVDNTSDANKPVSTAQATADSLVASNAATALSNHEADTTNVHGIVDTSTIVKGPASVTDDLPVIFDGTTGKLVKSKTYAAFKTLLSLVKGDVGLGNVDNTSDANKPVSTAQAAADAAVLAAAQPLDSDLTTIAGLTATTDSFIQSKSSAWSSRTLAQVMSDLAGLGTTFQPLDSDLTTIAGLTATTDNFMVATASAWASRTPTQARTQLGLGSLATQSGTFSGTSSGTNTGDQTISDATITTTDITTNNFTTAKHGFVPKGTNVGSFLKDDGTWASVPGGGDALTSNPLSQFASTTSLQLKNTISNETGSGALVFADSPALTTPTGIVKGDVGLGNVDNTSNATERAAVATVTNKTLSDVFMGTSLDSKSGIVRDITLTASTDFATLDSFEVGSAYVLEIPATSTLEIFTYAPVPAFRALNARWRQGGTTGNGAWNTAGTNNTDISDKAVSMQVGTQATTGGSSVVITFPVPFTQIPVVTATVVTAVSTNAFARISAITATNFTVQCISDAGGGANQDVCWIAVGQ